MGTTNQAQKQCFSVAQANKMLPLVGSIVSDLVNHYRDLCERRDRLAAIRQRGGASSGPYREELDQMDEEMRQDAQKLQDYLDELSRLGVEFKDFNIGLVDFPTRIDGREAYLCWKLGEPEVAHWHELDSGFRGRQPLTQEITTRLVQGAADP